MAYLNLIELLNFEVSVQDNFDFPVMCLLLKIKKHLDKPLFSPFFKKKKKVCVM